MHERELRGPWELCGPWKPCGVWKLVGVFVLMVLLVTGCTKTVDDYNPGAPDGEPAAGVRNATPHPTRIPDPTRTPAPTATRPPRPGDRALPIRLGQSARVTTIGNRVLSLTLTDVSRGTAAWERVLAANQFNNPPPSALEYLLVYAEVEYLEGPEDRTLRLTDNGFRIVSKNQVMRPIAVVEPEPTFDLEFFPGGRGAGWMVWAVYEDDPAPLLVYDLAYDGSGGTYFALER